MAQYCSISTLPVFSHFSSPLHRSQCTHSSLWRGGRVEAGQSENKQNKVESGMSELVHSAMARALKARQTQGHSQRWLPATRGSKEKSDHLEAWPRCSRVKQMWTEMRRGKHEGRGRGKMRKCGSESVACFRFTADFSSPSQGLGNGFDFSGRGSS